MFRYLLFLTLFFPIIVNAQTSNTTAVDGNGVYSSLGEALKNINDVKTLSVKEDDAYAFLVYADTFPNLQNLSINYCEEPEANYTVLASINTLKDLTIGYSTVRILPDYITLLPQLKKASFIACLMKRLPAEFFNNPNLETIFLNANYLASLPEIPVNNNVGQISLESNYFITLPESFQNLQKLHTLNLKGNRFTNFPMDILKLKKLKALDLSSNNISFIPEDISELSSLETLFLIRTKIKYLPKTMKNMKLRTVLISDTGLTPEEKENIAKALPETCILEWTSDLFYTIDE